MRFRMRRADAKTVWLECRFKLVDHSSGRIWKSSVCSVTSLSKYGWNRSRPQPT